MNLLKIMNDEYRQSKNYAKVVLIYPEESRCSESNE